MRRIGFLAAALVLAGCSGKADAPAEEAAQLPRFELASSDPVKHGERISAVLGCSGCHGEDLQGRDWSDDMGVLWTANLTQSAAQYDDAQLVSMITTGRKPGRDLLGMPSHIFTQLSPSDLAAIVAYMRSVQVAGVVHPEPTFAPELRAMLDAGTVKTSAGDVDAADREAPREIGPDHAVGRYIVRATCAECHGLDLKGGPTPFPGDKPRPDLTAMVPAYDPGDFVTLMRTGKATGDREVGLMSEVARGRFSHLTDAEVEAVRSYIVAMARNDP